MPDLLLIRLQPQSEDLHLLQVCYGESFFGPSTSTAAIIRVPYFLGPQRCDELNPVSGSEGSDQ